MQSDKTQPLQWILERKQMHDRQKWHDIKVDVLALPVVLLIVTFLYLIALR